MSVSTTDPEKVFRVKCPGGKEFRYDYDWEVRGFLAYVPATFLPCVVYKDNEIFQVKAKPETYVDFPGR
jgi:hypothetical protein